MASLIIMLIILVGLAMISAVGYGGFRAISAHRVHKAIQKIPAPALASGDISLVKRVRTYYRLSLEFVRILERLLDDPTFSIMLDPIEKDKIQTLINEFYEESK